MKVKDITEATTCPNLIINIFDGCNRIDQMDLSYQSKTLDESWEKMKLYRDYTISKIVVGTLAEYNPVMYVDAWEGM